MVAGGLGPETAPAVPMDLVAPVAASAMPEAAPGAAQLPQAPAGAAPGRPPKPPPEEEDVERQVGSRESFWLRSEEQAAALGPAAARPPRPAGAGRRLLLSLICAAPS